MRSTDLIGPPPLHRSCRAISNWVGPRGVFAIAGIAAQYEASTLRTPRPRGPSRPVSPRGIAASTNSQCRTKYSGDPVFADVQDRKSCHRPTIIVQFLRSDTRHKCPNEVTVYTLQDLRGLFSHNIIPGFPTRHMDVDTCRRVPIWIDFATAT